ncbi:cyclin-dependent kinase 3 [Platysternon megacephalum]|uniref:Cyclin-dependent kinase 3 n=1 Tax=Platysternon megacephalum TaxID=55544 RepID=A0A4D9DCT6_9SAUR|nr:cyclin-dependent kinase 3 [Platysternon megacephalum]
MVRVSAASQTQAWGYKYHPEVSCMSPDCVGLALKVLVPLEMPLSSRQQDLGRRLSMLDVGLYWGRSQIRRTRNLSFPTGHSRAPSSPPGHPWGYRMPGWWQVLGDGVKFFLPESPHQ